MQFSLWRLLAVTTIVAITVGGFRLIGLGAVLVMVIVAGSLLIIATGTNA